MARGWTSPSDGGAIGPIVPALRQQTAQNIYFFEAGEVFFHLCYGQCFRVKPDLSCSRLFMQRKLGNKHSVILLSHVLLLEDVDVCLMLSSPFPVDQMVDVGFLQLFSQILLDSTVTFTFNFPCNDVVNYERVMSQAADTRWSWPACGEEMWILCEPKGKLKFLKLESCCRSCDYIKFFILIFQYQQSRKCMKLNGRVWVRKALVCLVMWSMSVVCMKL